jgi:ABC-type glycerol-3-phosphate transport system permease component
VLLYAGLALPFTAFIMTSYFSQLPEELEDAACIDGCSETRIFWQVMLPLARPAVTTIMVLNFRTFWNELLLSITMVTDPAMRTLPAAIYNFIGDVGSNYAMAASSLVVSMLPVLIVYILLSERFVEGMTAGAVKA